MNCGAVDMQSGSFTTYRQFLEYVTTQAGTILTLTIDVQLKATNTTQGMLPYSSCQSTGVAEQSVLDAAGRF